MNWNIIVVRTIGKGGKTMKCPLMTVHDLDCIEECGNITCKHWKEVNSEDKTSAGIEQI